MGLIFDNINTDDIKRGIAIIADTYGLNSQLGQLSEECAELIQAASKIRRHSDPSMSTPRTDYNDDLINIIEEIGDVIIVISEVKRLLRLDENDIVDSMRYKIIRTLKDIDIAKGEK